MMEGRRRKKVAGDLFPCPGSSILLQDVREGMEVVWETMLENPSAAVPEREIVIIRQYHEGLTNAV